MNLLIRQLTASITDVNCAVLTVNYRHAPEDVYPAAANDVLAAYQWIVDSQNIKFLKINPSRIAIGGLSAYDT